MMCAYPVHSLGRSTLGLVVAALILSTACASARSPEPWTEGAPATTGEQPPEHQRERKLPALVDTTSVRPHPRREPDAPLLLAIFEFEDMAFAWQAGGYAREIFPGMAELFEAALVKTGAFEIVNREKFERALEIASPSLSMSVGPETALEIGKAVGAEQVALGAVTRYDIEYGETTGRSSRPRVAAIVDIQMRLLDVATRRLRGIYVGHGVMRTSGEMPRRRYGESRRQLAPATRERFLLDDAAWFATIDVVQQMVGERPLRSGSRRR